MRWVMFVLVLCGSCMAQTGGLSAEETLRSLMERRGGGVILQRDLDTLAQGIATESGRLWPDVQRLLDSGDVPIVVRERIVDKLSQLPNQDVADRLIAEGTRWAETIARGPGYAGDQRRLLTIVLDSALRPPLATRWNRNPEALRLYVDVMVKVPMEADRVLRLLRASEVDAHAKQGVAQDMVVLRPHLTEVESGVLALLGPEAVSKLRATLHASVTGEVHFGAAAALAHLGDEGTIPDLRAAAQRIELTAPELVVYMEWYIWRIQNQHPPEKLVEYIEHNSPDSPQWVWALQRCTELGLDKARLRVAILECVKALPTTEVYNTFAKKNVLSRPAARIAKAEGLRLGVLARTDLPDVRVRTPADE
jgi:hypothetical protein